MWVEADGTSDMTSLIQCWKLLPGSSGKKRGIAFSLAQG